jgi:hypothetical protein
MTRSEYLYALMHLMRANEIKISAANPSAHMTRTHILLHYVALRRLGVKAC